MCLTCRTQWVWETIQPSAPLKAQTNPSSSWARLPHALLLLLLLSSLCVLVGMVRAQHMPYLHKTIGTDLEGSWWQQTPDTLPWRRQALHPNGPPAQLPIPILCSQVWLSRGGWGGHHLTHSFCWSRGKPFLTSPAPLTPCVAITLQAEKKHSFTSVTTLQNPVKISYDENLNTNYATAEPWGPQIHDNGQDNQKIQKPFTNVNHIHI